MERNVAQKPVTMKLKLGFHSHLYCDVMIVMFSHVSGWERIVAAILTALTTIHLFRLRFVPQLQYSVNSSKYTAVIVGGDCCSSHSVVQPCYGATKSASNVSIFNTVTIIHHLISENQIQERRKWNSNRNSLGFIKLTWDLFIEYDWSL